MNVSKNRRTSLIVGIVLILITLVPAVIGIFHTPFDPDAVDRLTRLKGMSGTHWFGTDHLGRDVLSRVMTGIRTTFLVAFGIVAIGAFFGVIIGAITGYFGGVVDEVIMRLNDALASFPSVLLAMLSVAVFGTSTKNVVLVLGILFIPSFARITRSEFLREKEKDYVKNIRLHGASNFRIMFRHILPNTRESLLASLSIGINNAILAESSMSYLGLGVQPPTASLGRMMSEGQTYIKTAPWIVLWPGLAIIVTVMGFSIISDAFGNRKSEAFGVFATRRMKQALLKFREGDVDEDVEDEASKGVVKSESAEKGASAGVMRTMTAEERAAAAEQKEETVKTLQVKNLHIVVNETPVREVVRGTDFHVNEGEVLGIVGESGSGKSFSATAIMNLVEGKGMFVADSINFCGKELVGLKESEFKKLRGDDISMVFQEPMTALDPSKKIGKVMKAVVKNGDETKISSLLNQVGLEDTKRILNSYPGELSGGQRQRILIAMAIANDPKLLICDEPTTALDADVANKIVELLEKLHEEKKMSVIFISHDIAITRKLCDRIIIMRDGEIVERGNADVLTTAPKSAYARELIEAAKGHDYKEMARREREKASAGKTTGDKGAIIQVKNLNVSYDLPKKKKLEVIKDMSFFVKRGECFGISGESGSGKTTLLKVLCGILDHEGEVKVDGRFSMVFQDPYSSLNPSMQVRDMLKEVLILGRKVRGEEQKEYAEENDEARILEVMKNVELSEDYLERYPDELSGGQRQRVAIAMAIINRPDIIFLDEPVTALDVTIQDKIMTLLATLQGRYNLTYVMISHDRRLLNNACDRVLQVGED